MSGTTKTMKKDEHRLDSSGRSAARTSARVRHRSHYDTERTYGGDVIDDDPAVCLHCTIPAASCHGEEQCYLRQKARRESRKTDTAARLLEKWEPSGIYDIWGESL